MRRRHVMFWPMHRCLIFEQKRHVDTFPPTPLNVGLHVATLTSVQCAYIMSKYMADMQWTAAAGSCDMHKSPYKCALEGQA